MSDRKDARKIRPHPHHQGVCVGDRSAPATWDRLRGLGRFSHWALQVAGTSFAPLSPWHGDPLSQERAVVGLARQLPAVPCWIQRRWLWPLTALRHNPGSSLAVSLGRLSAVQTTDNRFQGPSQPNLFRSQMVLCLYSQGRSILCSQLPHLPPFGKCLDSEQSMQMCCESLSVQVHNIPRLEPPSACPAYLPVPSAGGGQVPRAAATPQHFGTFGNGRRDR